MLFLSRTIVPIQFGVRMQSEYQTQQGTNEPQHTVWRRKNFSTQKQYVEQHYVLLYEERIDAKVVRELSLRHMFHGRPFMLQNVQALRLQDRELPVPHILLMFDQPEAHHNAPKEVWKELRTARQLCKAVAYIHGAGYTLGTLCTSHLTYDAARRQLVLFNLRDVHPIRSLEKRNGPPLYLDASPDTMVVCKGNYSAPEQLLGACCSEKQDMWSVGCVLFEMLSGEPLIAYSESATKMMGEIFAITGSSMPQRRSGVKDPSRPQNKRGSVVGLRWGMPPQQAALDRIHAAIQEARGQGRNEWRRLLRGTLVLDPDQRSSAAALLSRAAAEDLWSGSAIPPSVRFSRPPTQVPAQPASSVALENRYITLSWLLHVYLSRRLSSPEIFLGAALLYDLYITQLSLHEHQLFVCACFALAEAQWGTRSRVKQDSDKHSQDGQDGQDSDKDSQDSQDSDKHSLYSRYCRYSNKENQQDSRYCREDCQKREEDKNRGLAMIKWSEYTGNAYTPVEISDGAADLLQRAAGDIARLNAGHLLYDEALGCSNAVRPLIDISGPVGQLWTDEDLFAVTITESDGAATEPYAADWIVLLAPFQQFWWCNTQEEIALWGRGERNTFPVRVTHKEAIENLQKNEKAIFVKYYCEFNQSGGQL